MYTTYIYTSKLSIHLYLYFYHIFLVGRCYPIPNAQIFAAVNCLVARWLKLPVTPIFYVKANSISADMLFLCSSSNLLKILLIIFFFIKKQKDCKCLTCRCRHNSKGCCVHCSPLEPWDEGYLKEHNIKHMSFHAYLRKITSGNFISLDELSCKIKPGELVFLFIY